VQIRPKNSIDGKLRSLNGLLVGWYDFAREELAEDLDRASRVLAAK
jgi:hypothetical protein